MWSVTINELSRYFTKPFVSAGQRRFLHEMVVLGRLVSREIVDWSNLFFSYSPLFVFWQVTNISRDEIRLLLVWFLQLLQETWRKHLHRSFFSLQFCFAIYPWWILLRFHLKLVWAKNVCICFSSNACYPVVHLDPKTLRFTCCGRAHLFLHKIG